MGKGDGGLFHLSCQPLIKVITDDRLAYMPRYHLISIDLWILNNVQLLQILNSIGMPNTETRNSVVIDISHDKLIKAVELQYRRVSLLTYLGRYWSVTCHSLVNLKIGPQGYAISLTGSEIIDIEPETLFWHRLAHNGPSVGMEIMGE